ncbi:extracellular solute-binding protein [Paenibacillus sp. M1]|uniref:Extracellular solute-binding protein n=1 Tax=Paenibacillus haidiansis TaxID=1574488 RepID=A0ABU7VY72_9BACL
MKWFVNWGWVALYAVVLSISVIIIAMNDSEPIEEPQTDKITLTFRHFWIKEHDREMLKIFEDVVDQFQTSHPNVKVNFEGMDQTDHRERKLKSEMVTGTPPDMFVLFGGGEIEPYVRANRLMDLTDFVQENGLDHQFQDLHLWTFGDHIYGLPLEGHAEPVYYNKEIFEKFDISPPKTLDELDAAVKLLKSKGYIPFALGNEERWPGAIFAHYLMDRYAGPELINELAKGSKAVSFNNSGYLQAFVHYKQWVNEGAFSPSANDLSTEEAIDLFTSGKAAMYVNGSWDINLFHNDDSPDDFPNRVGVIPFPTLLPEEDASLAGGYSIGIALSANLDEAKSQAALELMKTFYTEDVQRRVVYEGQRIPSMKISFDSEETGPVFEQVVRLMEHSDNIFLAYDNVLTPEVNKTFLKVIEGIISGNASPNEALDQIQAASEQYWRQRNSSLPD